MPWRSRADHAEPRPLPNRFVVYLALASALWRPDSYDNVTETQVGVNGHQDAPGGQAL